MDWRSRAPDRARLSFHWVDEWVDVAWRCAGDASAIWIDAPAGAGKTALAERIAAHRGEQVVRLSIDDLEPDAEAWARRFLEACCRSGASNDFVEATGSAFGTLVKRLDRIGAWTLIVDVIGEPSDAFARFLVALIRDTPGSGLIAVTCRYPPPARVARLELDSKLARLPASRLGLSRTQAIAIARAADCDADDGDIKCALQDAGFWLVGFCHLLLSDRWTAGGALDIYLEQEVASALQWHDLEALRTLAYHPNLPLRVIRRLDLEVSFDRLLAIARGNFLVEDQENVLSINPLFADWLRRSVADPRHAADRHARLALALARAGDEDAAVPHWLEAGDWDAACDAIRRRAPACTGQDDRRRIVEWAERLPPHRRQPGDPVQLWQTLVRLPEEPRQASEALQQTLRAAHRHGDADTAALAWAGLVEGIWLQWGDFSQGRELLGWLDWFGECALDSLGPLTAARLSAAAVLLIGVLAPERDDAKAWLGAAETSARVDITDAERLKLLHVSLAFSTWVWGDREHAIRAYDLGRVVESRAEMAPFDEQMWHAAVAGYCLWFEVDPVDGIRRIEHALARASESGVDAWRLQLQALGACMALRSGDPGANDWVRGARESTRPSRPTDASFHAWVSGWAYLRAGDFPAAAGLAREAHELIAGCGPMNAQLLARLALARARRLLGDARSAWDHTRAVSRQARAYQMGLCHWLARMTAAGALRDLGRERIADRLLREAIAVGREQGYLGLPWHAASEIEDLCERGRSLGLDADYLQRLAQANGVHRWLRSTGVSPESSAISIYALGPLAVAGPNGPIRVRGKGAHLLQWLAAAGERGLTEAEISDALWPDAEGDQARRSFDTLVYRLRRRLGIPGAVPLRDGQLFLEPTICWVDVDALDRLLGSSGATTDAWAMALELAEQAGVHAALWPDPRGSRLRQRFGQLGCQYIEQQLQAGAPESACEVAERALAIDPTSHRLHSLLLCLAQRSGSAGQVRRMMESWRAGTQTIPAPHDRRAVCRLALGF